jgi:hypothetical protein
VQPQNILVLFWSYIFYTFYLCITVICIWPVWHIKAFWAIWAGLAHITNYGTTRPIIGDVLLRTVLWAVLLWTRVVPGHADPHVQV